MSGNDNPRGYSTQINSDGTMTSGHTVTISPGRLDQAITEYKSTLTGAPPASAGMKLQNSVMGSCVFGTIPNAPAIDKMLTQFITDRVAVMQGMTGVLDDFVDRVEAAAQMGYDSDPETRAIAKVAEQALMNKLRGMRLE